MSLSEDQLISVMAYVDGQLDDDDVKEVEVLLAGNDEARRLVQELGATGDWVRESCREKAVAAEADKIANAVMAEAEALGGGKVITLERVRARRALNQQRVKEFGALAAVAAVFALIWAWPGARTPDPHDAETVAKGPAFVSPMPRPPEKTTPDKPATAPPETSPQLAVGSNEGVDIENVESPHQVSVFYLPVTNKNAASVVVWIGEPEEVH